MLRLCTFLLFLLGTEPILGTPVALFLNQEKLLKEQMTVVLGHGIIVSETLVLTTQLPLKSNVGKICVIPREQGANTSEAIAKKLCKAVQSSIGVDWYDLKMFKVKERFLFSYRVISAPLPAEDRFKSGFGPKMDFLRGCVPLYNIRDMFNSEEFPVAMVDAEISHSFVLETEKPEVIQVSLKKKVTFCSSDNGLPLFCNQAVVGLYKYPSETPKSCETSDRVLYVNMLHKKAKYFLSFFAKADGNWPKEIPKPKFTDPPTPSTTEMSVLSDSTTEMTALQLGK